MSASPEIMSKLTSAFADAIDEGAQTMLKRVAGTPGAGPADLLQAELTGLMLVFSRRALMNGMTDEAAIEVVTRAVHGTRHVMEAAEAAEKTPPPAPKLAPAKK